MGVAAHFDDNRSASTDRRCLAHDVAAEDRAGAALEQALLARLRLAGRRFQGDARGHAAAGRAAIDLPAGEDADIAAWPAVRAVAAIGQDRAIEEGEVGLVGM